MGIITKIYELAKEDWTHLGGPMGTEYTTIIWTKPFSTLQKAKEFAEKDHEKQENRAKIKWESKSPNTWFSGDLLSHAYYIRIKKVD